MKRLALLVALFALTACAPSAPSESTIQTAIAQTQTVHKVGIITYITSTPKPAPSVMPTPNITPTPIGIMLSVTSVSDPQEPGTLFTPQPGKRLISIEIVIENNSASQLHVQDDYFTLLDSENFVYQGENSPIISDSINWLQGFDLSSNEKIKGLVAFVIPSNAVLASIKFATPAMSEAGVYLQVGLSK